MPFDLEAVRVALTSQPVQAAFTLFILTAAVYGFVSEKLPPDVTALLALLGLMIVAVLTPQEAFAGFSHPATVSVAAVLVLSAGLERTGVFTFLARRVLGPIGRSESLLTAVLMVVTAALSAFVNNTAAVAVFIPVVLEVCRRTLASPGRLLMPMAHAARFGGMCTLIGTSTNLVAHEFARFEGLPGFAMFELGKVGLPMMIAGSAYVLLVGRWFLPHTAHEEPTPQAHTGDYMAEIVVQPGSPWIGREMSAPDLARDHEVELLQVVRGSSDLALLEEKQRYLEGDHLWVRGPLKRVLALGAQEGLELRRPRDRKPNTEPHEQPVPAARAIGPRSSGHPGPQDGESSERARATEAPAPAGKTAAAASPKLPLSEVVVLPRSSVIGRTLKDARFAERYDAVVLALHRPGEHLPERPGRTPIRAGDVLVVEGEATALRALTETPGFLLVGAPAHPEERPEKLGIATVTLVSVVLSVTFGLLPIVTAATAGCAVLMLTGCLTPREAYRAIDWSIIFVLAGALALGTALGKTGVTHWLAGGLAALTNLTGPFVVLAGFLFLSILISEFISNSGTVALLAPVAFSTATEMGVNPMALLAAVALGASAAFAMPIGYQTSLMIYGPGGYRFRDFIRMGIPLDLLLFALGLWLIPQAWPLVVR